MIYWAKFEGKLFFDPECTGPLLQTLPLNTYTNFLIPAIYSMSQKVRAPHFDRVFIRELYSSQSSGVFL